MLVSHCSASFRDVDASVLAQDEFAPFVPSVCWDVPAHKRRAWLTSHEGDEVLRSVLRVDFADLEAWFADLESDVSGVGREVGESDSSAAATAPAC